MEKAIQTINLVPFFREIDDSETSKYNKYALHLSNIKTAEVSSNGVLFVGGKGKGKDFVQVFDISKLENISIACISSCSMGVSDILGQCDFWFFMKHLCWLSLRLTLSTLNNYQHTGNIQILRLAEMKELKSRCLSMKLHQGTEILYTGTWKGNLYMFDVKDILRNKSKSRDYYVWRRYTLLWFWFTINNYNIALKFKWMYQYKDIFE